MDHDAILSRLCGLGAPSGFEGPASRAAAELLRPLADEVTVDRMGSVLALRRCGREGAKRLLLDAHLDQIGFVITEVLEEGFCRFIGMGVDPRMLLGSELTVLTQDGPIPAVVSCIPPHLQKAGDNKKALPIEEMVLDLGMSGEKAKETVRVGDYAAFAGEAFQLKNDLLCGKSMDDRSCFVTLLRAAELLRDRELDVDLYLLGSTREEVSGAGATVGTWAVQPDFCVAVDVTHGKTPDGPADKAFAIGGGPAIGVGPNMTRWMTNRMLAKAKERQIPYQLEVMSGHTGTNGWEMQISREGVATSVLSLPLKYMHSPIEVLSLADMEQVAALLVAFTEGLGKEAARR